MTRGDLPYSDAEPSSLIVVDIKSYTQVGVGRRDLKTPPPLHLAMAPDTERGAL